MNLNQSFYQIVKETAERCSHFPALYFENQSILYSKFIDEVDKMAAILVQLGVREKDIVTVCLPNMPQAVYAFYAINKIGAICYEVHPKTPKKQMERYLRQTKSKVLIALNIFTKQYLELQQEQNLTILMCNPYSKIQGVKALVCLSQSPKEKKPNLLRYEKIKVNRKIEVPTFHWNVEETAVLLNSGGTSGEAKIIELSTRAINKLASNGIDILGITNPEGIHMLAILPMFHGFGLCMGIHSPLMYGACVTLMIKFHTKDTIQLLKKHKVTIMIGVPALYKALLRKPKFYSDNLKDITVAYVGGDFVSQDLVDKFNHVMERYGSKARLLEGYGLTETVTVCTVNTENAYRKGSVGKAVRYANVKIVDLKTRETLPYGTCGEIAVSGEILMNGYYQDDKLTEEVFIKDEQGIPWVLTGDYGYIDQDGYVYFKQRLKRIVKVSGILLCPSDIEKSVSGLDDIHEVYATSVEHDQRGSMILLYVVKDKDSKCTLEQLNEKIKQHIKEEISVYAIPEKIIYLENMPKTEVGKIDGKYLDHKAKGEN